MTSKIPASTNHPRTARHASRLRLLLLPACLLFFGIFFFLGDLGPWTDDYFFVQRVPETGEIGYINYDKGAIEWRLWMPAHRGFFRPLHMKMTGALVTLTWHHFWIAHAVNALAHAAVASLLFAVMRTLRISLTSAAVAAILFLIWPVAYEVIYWPSSLSTGVATGLFLALCLLFARAATGRFPHWALGIAAPVLAFVIACYNEQPIATIPAIPLLYLALAPVALPLRTRLLRAAVPTALAGIATAAYLALYISTVPPGEPGSVSSITPPDQWGARAVAYLPQIRHWLLLHSFKDGALELGWSAITRHTAYASLAGIALLAAYTLWARTLSRADDADKLTPPAAPDRRTWPLALAFGAAVFALAFLPFIPLMMYATAEARFFYLPLTGGAIVLACIGDGLASIFATARPRVRAAARVAFFTLLFPAITALVVMQIGVQQSLRNRTAIDRSIGERLREAVPNPPSATAFFPLNMDVQTSYTGSRRFDRMWFSAYAVEWSTVQALRYAYERIDLTSSFCWWIDPPVADVTPRGLLARRPCGHHTNPAGEWIFFWELTVPYALTNTNDLYIITKIRTLHPDGPLEIDLPLAATHVSPDAKTATWIFDPVNYSERITLIPHR